MPRVNLYVRDADMPVWDRARAFTKEQDGESLSTFVAEALGRHLDDKERLADAQRQSDGKMKPVEVKGYDSREKFRRLRFTGAFVGHEGDIAVYITRGGKIVLADRIVEVFDSFEDLCESDYEFDGGFMLQIAEALGEDWAEEID